MADSGLCHEGACHCGAVRFSFSGRPRGVTECVCESCRKAHGASVVGWVCLAAEQFSLHKGQRTLRWYQSSAESQRGFCVECGTRVLFRSDRWPGEIHVTLASLKTPHNFVAAKVSFAEELPPWTLVSIGHGTGRSESSVFCVTEDVPLV